MTDWSWKVREAVDRIRTRYDHIGRKTGAPFLGIVYPPEAELAVMREWKTLSGTLGMEFALRTVDVLDVTLGVVRELGIGNVVGTLADPMPGSDPEEDLGRMWTVAVADRVREASKRTGGEKPVVVLTRLAALHPTCGPRFLMQQLWDSEQTNLDGPVVVFIPGTLVEPRVYSFLNVKQELMYRGDLL